MRKFPRGLRDEINGMGGFLRHESACHSGQPRDREQPSTRVTARTLTPELLDSLPSDHPDARHSRRDLRLINRVMGNHRWFERMLPRLIQNGDRTLELGAGTGELATRLTAAGIAVDALDFCARPATWPADRAWHVGDLRTFSGYGGYAAVLGNLILHHFADDELATLGATLQRTARVVLASEPKRSVRAQRIFSLLARSFGASHVTRHDAHVSIAAGFRDDELPRALGLVDSAWAVHCETTAFGAYRMVAVRRP
jgi:hypothetical protein